MFLSSGSIQTLQHKMKRTRAIMQMAFQIAGSIFFFYFTLQLPPCCVCWIFKQHNREITFGIKRWTHFPDQMLKNYCNFLLYQFNFSGSKWLPRDNKEVKWWPSWPQSFRYNCQPWVSLTPSHSQATLPRWTNL